MLPALPFAIIAAIDVPRMTIGVGGACRRCWPWAVAANIDHRRCGCCTFVLYAACWSYVWRRSRPRAGVFLPADAAPSAGAAVSNH
jgi:hypothetical protein